MSTLDELLVAAQTLNAEEKMRLVESLWEDVPPSDWPAPSAEWIAEAQRRSLAYDEGRMSASKWIDVRESARRKAGLDD